MEDQKQQLIQRLKEAKNVLVTVSRDPSVDQLAAAIGLTIAFNRLDKHATAVYSGATPSTLQFLRPEDTLEKTTDSLRDFIIALDKSKADKLRYKVEDQVVRIFITPYHTAISEADLDFSQGDFNVDVVVALGVKTQQDIDEAVQAHGRILHDATVAVLSTEGQPELGTLNVVNTEASSLSEMALELVEGLSNKVLDTQIATALLTGIVAMTDRFSNDRTTPKTMSASATLMAAGANQQLITSELEAPAPEPEQVPTEDQDENQNGDSSSDEAGAPEAPPRDPGTLEIEHDEAVVDDEPAELPPVDDEDSDNPQIHVDEDGKLSVLDDAKPAEAEFAPFLEQPEPPKVEIKRERMTSEPSFDNPLSANTEEERESPATEQLEQPSSQTPILSHNEHVLTSQPAFVPPELPSDAPDEVDSPAETETPAFVPQEQGQKTLAEIEQEVDSPHLHADDVPPAPDFVDSARAAVDAAHQTNAPAYVPEPITALNAQPLGDALHDDSAEVSPENESTVPMSETPAFTTPPATSAPSAFPGAPLPSFGNDPSQPAPPPVPPPMY